MPVVHSNESNQTQKNISRNSFRSSLAVPTLKFYESEPKSRRMQDSIEFQIEEQQPFGRAEIAEESG